MNKLTSRSKPIRALKSATEGTESEWANVIQFHRRDDHQSTPRPADYSASKIWPESSQIGHAYIIVTTSVRHGHSSSVHGTVKNSHCNQGTTGCFSISSAALLTIVPPIRTGLQNHLRFAQRVRYAAVPNLIDTVGDSPKGHYVMRANSSALTLRVVRQTSLAALPFCRRSGPSGVLTEAAATRPRREQWQTCN